VAIGTGHYVYQSQIFVPLDSNFKESYY